MKPSRCSNGANPTTPQPHRKQKDTDQQESAVECADNADLEQSDGEGDAERMRDLEAEMNRIKNRINLKKRSPPTSELTPVKALPKKTGLKDVKNSARTSSPSPVPLIQYSRSGLRSNPRFESHLAPAAAARAPSLSPPLTPRRSPSLTPRRSPSLTPLPSTHSPSLSPCPESPKPRSRQLRSTNNQQKVTVIFSFP